MARGRRRLKSRQHGSKGIVRSPLFVVAGEATVIPIRSLVRALATTGAAMSVLAPAHAVSLGEVIVESTLGQPLSARIPVDLTAGESIGAGCVSSPASRTTELANVPRPVLTVPETAVPGTHSLRVTTSGPLYEPMYELQVQVRCTGTALLVRQYVLMLDLPAAATVAAPAVAEVLPPAPAVTAALPARAEPPQAPVAARPPHPQHRVTLGTPIAPGSTYRVTAGDTLSTIAARVSDRGGRGLWRTVDLIFEANPHAFIGGSQDLIKLGSEISIPAAPDHPAVMPESSAAVALATPPGLPKVEAPPAAPLPADVAPAEPQVATGSAAVVTTPRAEEAPTPAAPAPVFQDEQAPAVTTAATQEATASAPPEPARSPGAPPWLAALIGLLIGAAASLVLLRERLTEALRTLLSRDGEPVAAQAAPASSTNVPPRVGRTLLPPEPSMVVVEERHDEAEPVAAETAPPPARRPAVQPAAIEITAENELSSLFGDDNDLHSLESYEQEPAQSEAGLDLDLSAAAPDVTIDEDIGWIGDETALTATQQSAAVGDAGGIETEHIDLQTLSEKAPDDPRISQTLKEALNLLESDYEEELTASQVIDQRKLKEVLDAGNEEDTLVRTGTDHNPRPRR